MFYIKLKRGFPCKSGVGGALMIVIPGVCGFCTWSPRLDDIGNSVRGVHFCKLMARNFSFHAFAPLLEEKKFDQYVKDNDEERRGGGGGEGEGEGEEKSGTGGVSSPSGQEQQQYDHQQQQQQQQQQHGARPSSTPSSSPTPRDDVRWDPRRHVERETNTSTDEESTLEMLWAAHDGSEDAVRQLISRGIDPNVSFFVHSSFFFFFSFFFRFLSLKVKDKVNSFFPLSLSSSLSFFSRWQIMMEGEHFTLQHVKDMYV